MEASGFTVKHGRGGAISFLVPGQERATRLRASTLGDGYDPEDIKAVIAGERPLPDQSVSAPVVLRRVNLIVDIEERLRSGKGAAYARWAKVYNLKQMAAALQFMQEQNITEYDQLSPKPEGAAPPLPQLTGPRGGGRGAPPPPRRRVGGWGGGTPPPPPFLTGTRPQSTAENILPSMRRSWRTTGQPRLQWESCWAVRSCPKWQS